MDRLNQSMGDATREMVATKSVNPKVDATLKAVYTSRGLAATEQQGVVKYRSPSQ